MKRFEYSFNSSKRSKSKAVWFILALLVTNICSILGTKNVVEKVAKEKYTQIAECSLTYRLFMGMQKEDGDLLCECLVANNFLKAINKEEIFKHCIQKVIDKVEKEVPQQSNKPEDRRRI